MRRRQKNPLSPILLWRIAPDSSLYTNTGITELGESWSETVFGRVKTAADDTVGTAVYLLAEVIARIIRPARRLSPSCILPHSFPVETPVCRAVMPDFSNSPKELALFFCRKWPFWGIYRRDPHHILIRRTYSIFLISALGHSD